MLDLPSVDHVWISLGNVWNTFGELLDHRRIMLGPRGPLAGVTQRGGTFPVPSSGLKSVDLLQVLNASPSGIACGGTSGVDGRRPRSCSIELGGGRPVWRPGGELHLAVTGIRTSL